MRDPHSTPFAAAPECLPEPGPLPRCPVCDRVPERISWRQRPGEPVVLAFDPCGHRASSPAAPVLAVVPAAGRGGAGGARPLDL
ncbi:hypothetical protein [Streptomyces sp. NBC_01408]|uniref:hypothetical protein n=1 Tax=Streptomyces sp. NBC_01408 TaxID=2903855 RepID=UPI0022560623|nr:hypothetical protein [Streptomyces sp. NBC_01408]MCX4695177.1 hypothetical protein [Streptomyces sp. NBC_01408]MCX4695178.1 hypothetical protein [Streptomyces sp. NBC_01408]